MAFEVGKGHYYGIEGGYLRPCFKASPMRSGCVNLKPTQLCNNNQTSQSSVTNELVADR